MQQQLWTSPPQKRTHAAEPNKWLPVVFVVCTITFLFCAYIRQHCLPLLQWGRPDEKVDQSMRTRGAIQLAIFVYSTTLLIICYVKCVLVHPGDIPDNDPLWDLSTSSAALPIGSEPVVLQETKKSGDRRHCKWCHKYKPDRSHHCRTCRTCILKMDHHCPWIYNCVGFANYKFFLLLLFYSAADTHLITWTMLESVKRCYDDPEGATFMTMFLTFLAETLSIFFMILVTSFLVFHLILASKNMTTIEYCEKSRPKKDSDQQWSSFEGSVYDIGMLANLRSVLGESMLSWWFPFVGPPGNGLSYLSDETRLTKDFDPGKCIRRRTHQRTQRPSLGAESRPPRQSYLAPGSYGADGSFGSYGSFSSFNSFNSFNSYGGYGTSTAGLS